MKVYPSMAAAVNDPQSHASKAMAAMRQAREEARVAVEALIAEGYSREEAWLLTLRA